MQRFVLSARSFWRGALIIILVMALAHSQGNVNARQQPARVLPPNAQTIYLPLMGKSGVPAVQPPTDAYFLPYEFPGEGVKNINTTDLAIDADGGVHMIYELVEFNTRIVYAYCPTNCVDRSKFATTILASVTGDETDTIYTADLVVDALGHPRVMWQVFTGLYFLACDQACATAGNWNTVHVRDIQGLDWEGRHFAIDPQGGYHYVYADDETGAGGTYYVSCAQNCASAESWSHDRIADEVYTDASVAVTRAGQPRFAFLTIDDQFVSRLGYAECVADCHQAAGWIARTFDPFGGTEGSFTLRMDRQGRPRIGLAPWWVESGDFPPQRITYLWCDQSCGQPTSAWNQAQVPVPGEDIAISSVDLALDAADRPVMAFNESGSGMQLARCGSNCESANATWTIEPFDSTTELNQNEPVPPVSGCIFPTWSTGYQISLALDALGKPRVAYDTNHLWFCGSSVRTDIKWARYRQW